MTDKYLIAQDEGKKYRVLVILPSGKKKFQWKVCTGGHLL